MQWIAPTWYTVAAPTLAMAAGTLAYASVRARSQLFGAVRWGGVAFNPREEAQVALTWRRSGPTGRMHDTVAVLEELRVPAAFFVPGLYVDRDPGWAERAHDHGHLLGNAGFDAQRSTVFQSSPYWRYQIDRADDAVYDAIARRPAFFQPPHGIKSPIMLREARLTGQRAVTWTAAGARGGVGRVARKAQAVVPGGILALRLDRRSHLEALPEIVRRLRGRGFVFVRLDRLLDLPGYRSGGRGGLSP